MSTVDKIQTTLTEVARKLGGLKQSELNSLKGEYAKLNRPDFLWHYLLQSFATMGRASGWQGLIGTCQNYDALRFEVLAKMPPDQRFAHISIVCRRAGIRMPDKKAGFIDGCFEAVQKFGSPKAARDHLLALPGREAKIKFLRHFPGIGPKYARNIMMDVYHEDFRDSIAIDVRIQTVSDAYGLKFSSYEEHELFWLDVAHGAGLEGWEMDRLLFNFQKDFLPANPAISAPPSAKIARQATRPETSAKASGYVQVKTKFCTTFPFAGLGALGMWYGEVVASEIPKWEKEVRNKRMGVPQQKVALCLRSDGYQLRRVQTDGVLVQVYDWKNGHLLPDSLLPVALLGTNMRIMNPADVAAHLLQLGGFAAEFVVDGITHKGWLLSGKSYSACWTEDGKALHFEEQGARNANSKVLRRLGP